MTYSQRKRPFVEDSESENDREDSSSESESEGEMISITLNVVVAPQRLECSCDYTNDPIYEFIKIRNDMAPSSNRNAGSPLACNCASPICNLRKIIEYPLKMGDLNNVKLQINAGGCRFVNQRLIILIAEENNRPGTTFYAAVSRDLRQLDDVKNIKDKLTFERVYEIAHIPKVLTAKPRVMFRKRGDKLGIVLLFASTCAKIDTVAFGIVVPFINGQIVV